jgi:hypothetical protein
MPTLRRNLCLPANVAQETSATGANTMNSQQPLHPDTQDLVNRFSQALAEKLGKAEKKYGYSNDWMRPDWMKIARAKLIQHIEKGDPLDVAAYCAFLWHHGEPTVDVANIMSAADLQTRLRKLTEALPKDDLVMVQVRDAIRLCDSLDAANAEIARLTEIAKSYKHEWNEWGKTAVSLQGQLDASNAEIAALKEAPDEEYIAAYRDECIEIAKELREHYLVEIAALKQDAARYRWGLENARWIRHEREAYVAIPVALSANLSCKALRDDAIGAAILSTKGAEA